ncbi:MAG: hypothetical protein R8G01_17425 [Ilumatobacteraceae bacterium]|nr:hypothetical protein [Ilumatobacteraceae bacterium]
MTGPPGDDDPTLDQPGAEDGAIDETERRAVERSTSEVLGAGVRRDGHGEIVPDPYPSGDEDEPDHDVLDEHRDDVDVVTGQSGVGRRAADTQGLTTADADTESADTHDETGDAVTE